MTWLGANPAAIKSAYDDEATYPGASARLWQRQDGGFLLDALDVDHVGNGSGSTLVGYVDFGDGTLTTRADYDAERGGKSWWVLKDRSMSISVCGTPEQVDAYSNRLDGDRKIDFIRREPVNNAALWKGLEDGLGDVDLDEEEAARAAA